MMHPDFSLTLYQTQYNITELYFMSSVVVEVCLCSWCIKEKYELTSKPSEHLPDQGGGVVKTFR